ncbi:MAG: nucleoside monophosphate kinase [Candidatus Moranbacteria bacterium]|nr:nucleoside monophosphate kinase [Candidatus Moranbacteria bacterium]
MPENKENKGPVIVLLGPPGSGKSTQADFFVKQLGAVHIDIGGALRNVAHEDTAFGREVDEIIHVRRELVPDDIVRAVLEREFRTIPPEKLVIVDGAPRSEEQVDDVFSVVRDAGRKFLGAVFIVLPVEESVDRISKRYSCGECGRKFILGTNISDALTPCPDCGGTVVQRQDDTVEGVRKRWQVFHDNTLPVLRRFERKGVLTRVSGRQTSEEIFTQIRKDFGI